MITLQMMQFTAVVLMLLLTVKLLFLRQWRIKSRYARQARWLMAGGTIALRPATDDGAEADGRHAVGDAQSGDAHPRLLSLRTSCIAFQRFSSWSLSKRATSMFM